VKAVPRTGFSKAASYSEPLDSKDVVWLPFLLVEAVKRRTFNINLLDRRRMIQGAGIKTPDHIKRNNGRKCNTGKTRWNWPCCGKLSWSKTHTILMDAVITTATHGNATMRERGMVFNNEMVQMAGVMRQTIIQCNCGCLFIQESYHDSLPKQSRFRAIIIAKWSNEPTTVEAARALLRMIKPNYTAS
jgi:hypothetical protein